MALRIARGLFRLWLVLSVQRPNPMPIRTPRRRQVVRGLGRWQIELPYVAPDLERLHTAWRDRTWAWRDQSLEGLG
jgi:hypothetical protein